jgi:hypothetical protein
VQGGFAKWGVIDRPQRVGMTVLQGYDPVVLDVQLQFDVVSQSINAASHAGFKNAVALAGQGVEDDIQKLEWMGGRGKLFASPFSPGQGDSPLIQVYSTNSNAVQTALIPPNCQDLDWVVTGIAYDQDPLRNGAGNRVRQIVDVTLTQHIASPGTSNDSPAVLAQFQKTIVDQVSEFPITKTNRTYRLIAVNDANNAKHSAAVAILQANKANKKLAGVRSVDKDLLSIKGVSPGMTVKVPSSVVHHA